MSESVNLKFFKEISKIPRASFNEKAVSDYVVEFAKERNLKVLQDDMNNVIVFKPASKGYENAPVVMLQSHLDMVAEKNKDSNHDFDNDPITLIEKEGILYADNTTLGADDGAGVAYMLGVLEEDFNHPALECVFTVEEETGLSGAEFLDTSMLKSSLCVGLDGSGETETYISSSGGVRGLITKDLQKEAVDTSKTVKLEVRGLLGGHSGGSIDEERGNANKIAGIILSRALKTFDLQLVSISGGLKLNAITRECDLEFTCEDFNAFKEWFVEVEAEFMVQYEFSDAGLKFNLSEGTTDFALSLEETKNLSYLLMMLPYGVIQKSKVIEDLVITSANIGTVNLFDNQLEVAVSLRATQTFVIENLIHQVEWLSQTLGFDVEFSNKYPGWNYDIDSKFRPHLLEVFKKLRGTDMDVVATHGGLELGIWKSKMPELDIVSFGPIMWDIHTPQERLDLASFDRTYDFLKETLSSLNKY